MRRLAGIAAILIFAAAPSRGQTETTLGDGTTATNSTAADGDSTTSGDDESAFFEDGAGGQGASTPTRSPTTQEEVENGTTTIDMKSTTKSIDGDASNTTGSADDRSSKAPVNGTGENSTEGGGEITDQITDEERQQMLDKHNEYRKKHNADPLELDDEASDHVVCSVQFELPSNYFLIE